jgi:hypothetical protein
VVNQGSETLTHTNTHTPTHTHTHTHTHKKKQVDRLTESEAETETETERGRARHSPHAHLAAEQQGHLMGWDVGADIIHMYRHRQIHSHTETLTTFSSRRRAAGI